jgi:hypothetical protein
VLTATKLIQKAYAEGKRTIEIDGVKLRIVRRDKKVTFTSGKETQTAVESWLIAKPVSGELTPLYNVERLREGNLRSKKS